MNPYAFFALEAALLLSSAVLLSVGAYQARRENAARRRHMVAFILQNDPREAMGYIRTPDEERAAMVKRIARYYR